MSPLRYYVEALTEDECRAIHADYCTLERTGQVGDGALRHHTEEWIVATVLDTDRAFVMWMDQIAKEVWRRFALPSLETSTEVKF